MKTWKKNNTSYIHFESGWKCSVMVDSKVWWQHQESLNGICLFVILKQWEIVMEYNLNE